MLNQIVYLHGCFIRAARWGLPPGQPHPLDAHMGRHRVTCVEGSTLTLQPLHTGGEPIHLPATAVWSIGLAAPDPAPARSAGD